MSHRFNVALLSFFLFGLTVCYGQSNLSFNQARQTAMTTMSQVKTADAMMAKGAALRKSGVRLDNPTLTYESPTGEFMTLGVQQSFAFPTVYGHQKKLAKANADLLDNEAKMTKAQARYYISTLYLDAQYNQAYNDLVAIQLKNLAEIEKNSELSYKEGEDDFLELNNARNQHNLIQHESFSAKSDLDVSIDHLKMMLKRNDASLTLDPLTIYTSLALAQNPSSSAWVYRLAQLSRDIAQREVALAKAENLPGFSIGYQNQGIAETPLKYRFGFGLQIPLWIWQNQASVKTAKANADLVKAQQESMVNEHEIRMAMLKRSLDGLQKTIDFYKNTGEKNIQAMETTSERMYDAGQITLIHHLDNLVRSYDIRLQYIDDIKAYNAILLELEYLNAN